MTTEELCAANPGLSISNFRTGEVIVIPTKEQEQKESPAVTTQQVKEEKQLTIVGIHKVKRKESIESICEEYSITKEDLIKANPVLKDKKLKRKMELHIPAPSAKEQPAQETIAQEEEKESALPYTKGINDDKVLNDPSARV